MRSASGGFNLFRRVLFSRSRLTLAEAKQLVREINLRLTAIGESRNLSVIPVSAAWYGLDPIHIKRRAEREAWADAARWVGERPMKSSRSHERVCF
jgi:hypothetical protein